MQKSGALRGSFPGEGTRGAWGSGSGCGKHFLGMDIDEISPGEITEAPGALSVSLRYKNNEPLPSFSGGGSIGDSQMSLTA